MESAVATAGDHGARRPARGVALVHALALTALAGAIALTVSWDRWNPPALAVIATFTIVSGLTYVETGSGRLKVSGTLLGLMLASTLLGPGPAAVIGALMTCFVWLRSREAGHWFR